MAFKRVLCYFPIWPIRIHTNIRFVAQVYEHFFIKIVFKNCLKKKMKTALEFKKNYSFAVEAKKTTFNFVVQQHSIF